MPQQSSDPVAEQLDRALLRLRRFFEPPRRMPDQHGGAPRSVQVSTLLVVDALARREGAATIGDVANALDVAHSTASRLVDRAVGRGVVERTSHPDDARRQHVRLTTDGRALAERARAHRAARLDALLADWDPADRAMLATLLSRFADDVGAESRRVEHASPSRG